MWHDIWSQFLILSPKVRKPQTNIFSKLENTNEVIIKRNINSGWGAGLVIRFKSSSQFFQDVTYEGACRRDTDDAAAGCFRGNRWDARLLVCFWNNLFFIVILQSILQPKQTKEFSKIVFSETNQNAYTALTIHFEQRPYHRGVYYQGQS